MEKLTGRNTIPKGPAQIAIPHFTLRSDILFLAIILLIGLLLRLDFLIANNFVIDADEAIVGLMAKHISEFKTLPTFYYGQHYMGSLEPLLTGVVFLIFGVSSIALKSVPLFFSLLLIVLIYQVGLELGNRGVARISAILAALPPQLLVVWSGMARGGFVEVVCVGTLAVILLLRWLRASPLKLGDTAVIAALLEFGWWINNQIVYFALPIGFFMLSYFLSIKGAPVWVRLRAAFPHLGVGAAAFIVGGLPYWVYNLRYDFVSLEIAQTAKPAEISEHVIGLFETAVPMLLGARRQWHSEEVFSGAALLTGFLYGVLLLLVVAKRWRQIRALLLLKIERRQPVEFFLLFLGATLAIFVLSSYGSLVESPRYLLPAYVAIFVLAASGLSILNFYSRRAAILVLAGLLTINFCSWYLGGRALPGEPFVYRNQRVSKDQSALARWLRRKGFDLVRTNYWIGYRLAFETQEQIRFSVYQTPRTVRIKEYEEEAQRRGRSTLPLVLVPAQSEIVRRAFAIAGFDYKAESVSGYDVIYDIAPRQKELSRVRESTIRASATDAAQTASLGIDGNSDTRWGSAKPQYPGMVYSVELAKPRMRGFASSTE